MTSKLSLLTIAVLSSLLVPAAAQTPGQRIVIEQPSSPFRQEGLVRVQTSINFFVAGPTGESEEAQKSRDNARRVIYQMAAHECDLLRETLAKDCHLESINDNIGRQFGLQQPEGYTVNGSMNLQITLK
ncbi:hypothetical protein [Bradyrhizobium sp. dw_78]|uniref:hypothetical protein n=1 Tax=Bradyrhizobium sp. dw_78 TaxID=2719793 RepID=UPI001C4A4F3A|nr:hypothetical protein [Bradyrhizobium sp. dw_78]